MALGKFRNAIMCEDIRDEVGGKISLMGIFTGDVLVPSFPAAIQLAFFIQFFSEREGSEPLSVTLQLLDDDKEVAKAVMQAPQSKQLATFVLPRGIATFEKPTTFRIVASMEENERVEVISKQILLAPAPTGT